MDVVVVVGWLFVVICFLFVVCFVMFDVDCVLFVVFRRLLCLVVVGCC